MKNNRYCPARKLHERKNALEQREPELAVPRLVFYDGLGSYVEELGVNRQVVSDDYANMLHEIVMIRWLGMQKQPYFGVKCIGQGGDRDSSWSSLIGTTSLSRGGQTLVEALMDCCEYVLNQLGIKCPGCGEKLDLRPRCTQTECCKPKEKLDAKA